MLVSPAVAQGDRARADVVGDVHNHAHGGVGRGQVGHGALGEADGRGVRFQRHGGPRPRVEFLLRWAQGLAQVEGIESRGDLRTVVKYGDFAEACRQARLHRRSASPRG